MPPRRGDALRRRAPDRRGLATHGRYRGFLDKHGWLAHVRTAVEAHLPPCPWGLHRAEGVARVEGFGPVTLARLAELLRGTTIMIQPVKDLSDRVRHTAYEHPESLRDQVHLVTGGDYWPYATSTSRHVDLDHPTPFDHGNGREPLPDQTGSHNSGPLDRRHHRWKTHAGYQSRQCGEDATSGSPLIDSASSSTTPAPTASIPRKHE